MPSPPDPLLEVLIAQLHLNGVLSGKDIGNMARRLRDCGRDDLANVALGVVMANALDAPAARRSTFQVVPDGGKGEG